MINNSYTYLKFDDRRMRQIAYPALSLLLPFVLKDISWPLTWPELFRTWFETLLSVIFIWEGVRFFCLKLRRRYPDFKDTMKRLSIQVPMILIYTLLIKNLIHFPLEYIYTQSFPPLDCFFKDLGIKYLIVLFGASVYESIFFYKQLESSIKEKEQAKQDHIRSQLEGLRNQVNPHFLFNSLNTLMNITSEDQNLAIRFLKKLSKVYRYILEIREEQLVLLRDELEFIQSYVFLQEERFRGNLKVTFDIEESWKSFHIIPLSLQILFENAIKHNIISTKRPLHIQVYVDDQNRLVVQNNLQRKKQVMHSTKVGLENVRNRYRFFTNETIEIIEDNQSFAVAIPLISTTSMVEQKML